jgi:hypothetical protein
MFLSLGSVKQLDRATTKTTETTKAAKITKAARKANHHKESRQLRIHTTSEHIIPKASFQFHDESFWTCRNCAS